jgi:RNA polymerase sigma factor (TIGR02999 family)
MNAPGDITRVLQRMGDQSADLHELMPLVYRELSELAHRALRRERDNHTLSTTALVHEAYIKLSEQDRVRWQNRSHFLAIASVVMRRILVNYAEARLAGKRGSGAIHVSLDDTLGDAAGVFTDDRAREIVEIDQLLERLAAFDARAARVVECRFFTGLSVEETAETMSLSPGTVKRDWAAARAWLKRELTPPSE